MAQYFNPKRRKEPRWAQLEMLVRASVFKSANELVGGCCNKRPIGLMAAYQPQPEEVRKGGSHRRAGIFGHSFGPTYTIIMAGKARAIISGATTLGLEVSYTPPGQTHLPEGADEPTYL